MVNVMIRKARVIEVRYSSPHQLLVCEIVAAPPPIGAEPAVSFQPGDACRAICYPDLIGYAGVGDTVQIEVSPLAKNLGTGGAAMVLANESRLPFDDLPNPGHLVKARYTPYQKIVLGADEPDSPFHSVLQAADSLQGLPVLVADIHSALPAIVAGFLQGRPDGKIGYIQTDGGALPLAFSRVVAELKAEGLLATTITCGQSFGGDYEAVSLPSALLIADLVADLDAVVVTQGPGNLGTDTRWGFSGIAGAEALRVAAALQGHPVAVLRMSSGDARPRHYGISHHTLTMLTWMELPPIDVVEPVFQADCPVEGPLADPDSSFAPLVASQMSLLSEHHRICPVETAGLYGALEDFPIKFSTMGRSLSEDPAAFLAAAVAGKYAAELLNKA
ncbi:MAG: DUF3866 family protein [Mobiluncus porci]|uniref:DUF3866 family protein n=2 Tax=Mobiluncus porci TaxID=2652278 RepID=UPI0023F001B1|nr:DUF3866 family protein [Mobiluncus porci]MDD7541423.1 DUF3866 family protein [Mobiluncus porci]MDY5748408.1 DUF3866 family protein [Mobiluncus porci]